MTRGKRAAEADPRRRATVRRPNFASSGGTTTPATSRTVGLWAGPPRCHSSPAPPPCPRPGAFARGRGGARVTRGPPARWTTPRRRRGATRTMRTRKITFASRCSCGIARSAPRRRLVLGPRRPRRPRRWMATRRATRRPPRRSRRSGARSRRSSPTSRPTRASSPCPATSPRSSRSWASTCRATTRRVPRRRRPRRRARSRTLSPRLARITRPPPTRRRGDRRGAPRRRASATTRLPLLFLARRRKARIKPTPPPFAASPAPRNGPRNDVPRCDSRTTPGPPRSRPTRSASFRSASRRARSSTSGASASARTTAHGRTSGGPAAAAAAAAIKAETTPRVKKHRPPCPTPRAWRCVRR